MNNKIKSAFLVFFAFLLTNTAFANDARMQIRNHAETVVKVTLSFEDKTYTKNINPRETLHLEDIIPDMAYDDVPTYMRFNIAAELHEMEEPYAPYTVTHSRGWIEKNTTISISGTKPFRLFHDLDLLGNIAKNNMDIRCGRSFLTRTGQNPTEPGWYLSYFVYFNDADTPLENNSEGFLVMAGRVLMSLQEEQAARRNNGNGIVILDKILTGQLPVAAHFEQLCDVVKMDGLIKNGYMRPAQAIKAFDKVLKLDDEESSQSEGAAATTIHQD